MQKRILIIITVGLALCLLGGCGKGKTNMVAEEPSIEETTPVEMIESNETETEVVVETTEEAVEETVEEPIEMVDWETWAKQEGNDDVCLVVWNKELNTQEILPTIFESGETYKIQEGDRFAVPFRTNIAYIDANDKEYIFDNSDFVELALPIEEIFDVYIVYNDENGEQVCLTYCFK